MKEKLNIGKIKAIADRELSYVSKLNFVMICYLFIEKTGWRWYYLLAIPLFIIWAYIDIKYIMPKEYGYIHSKSPFLQKLMKK